VSEASREISHEPRHPIQVVARRTGLSTDVIRAWERRYGAVSPRRSGTQRRLYSDADVEHLLLLRQSTDHGRRIGDVARLSHAELAALVEADREAAAHAEAVTPAPPRGASARAHFDACLAAVREMDPVALDAALVNAAVNLNVPVLLEDVLSPLLERVGEQWRHGPLRVAHEHLATSHLRSFLGGMVVSSNSAARGPHLVVATPPGQMHELGALMAAVTGAGGGWLALYLGPNVPIDEIAYTAIHKSARAVAISLCYPADDPHLPGEIGRLAERLPEHTVLLAGGAGWAGYRKKLDEVGALTLPTLADLRVQLDRLRSGDG